MARSQEYKGHLYELVGASAFEVGLTCDGKGVRTWWANEFEGQFPDISHPTIQETIEIHDKWVINLTETIRDGR